jgi:tRNA-dihydrouridine synthase
MMRQTGCDGVIVGRGCLGRPWLFRDLADAFDGHAPAAPPGFGEVLEVMFEHARRLSDWFGEVSAMTAFRRHISWYTKGFRLDPEVRQRTMLVRTQAEMRRLFLDVDRGQEFPPSAMRVRRGKKGGAQRVVLPLGYLDALDDATPPDLGADVLVSGG